MNAEVADSRILNYPLFEGDFGDPNDRIIANKMVIAAKNHQCSNCFGTIVKNERHRHHVGMYGGKSPFHYRYCSECCKAMAEFDEEKLAQRYSNGRKALEKSKGGAA